jgi:hypothetical protein
LQPATGGCSCPGGCRCRAAALRRRFGAPSAAEALPGRPATTHHPLNAPACGRARWPSAQQPPLTLRAASLRPAQVPAHQLHRGLVVSDAADHPALPATSFTARIVILTHPGAIKVGYCPMVSGARLQPLARGRGPQGRRAGARETAPACCPASCTLRAGDAACGARSMAAEQAAGGIGRPSPNHGAACPHAPPRNQCPLATYLPPQPPTPHLTRPLTCAPPPAGGRAYRARRLPPHQAREQDAQGQQRGAAVARRAAGGG